MRYTFHRYPDGSRLIRCNDQIVAAMERITSGWLVTDVQTRTDQYVPHELVAVDMLVHIAHSGAEVMELPKVA